MKKLILMALVAISAQMASAQEAMTKQKDGTYVVNTTTLGKDVKGYKAATPVEIYIKSDKVVKVEVLENREGPKYVNMVKKGIMDKWNGLKVKKAQELKVDAVSGATYTSNAIKENVKLGLKYYSEHKK